MERRRRYELFQREREGIRFKKEVGGFFFKKVTGVGNEMQSNEILFEGRRKVGRAAGSGQDPSSAIKKGEDPSTRGLFSREFLNFLVNSSEV